MRVFQNEKFGEVRTCVVNGEAMFCGVDVAKTLGYENPSMAVQKRVDTEDRVVLTKNEGIQNGYLNFSNFGNTFINESGLFSLILGSKLCVIHVNEKDNITAKKYPRKNDGSNFLAKGATLLNDTVSYHVVDEDKITTKNLPRRFSGSNFPPNGATFINESGLFSLIHGKRRRVDACDAVLF